MGSKNDQFPGCGTSYFINSLVTLLIVFVRCRELEAIHGELAPLVQIDMTPENDRTVEIHLEGKVISRKVDIRLTVRDFKKFLSKEVAKVPPSRFNLHFESLLSNYGATNLCIYRTRPLYTFFVEDGDRFYIYPR